MMEQAAFGMPPLPATVLTYGAVCVGTGGNVGIWNGSGWTDRGLMGGWAVKMLSWDSQGRLW